MQAYDFICFYLILKLSYFYGRMLCIWLLFDLKWILGCLNCALFKKLFFSLILIAGEEQKFEGEK